MTRSIRSFLTAAALGMASASQAALVAYYPFDGNALDASGNNRHGTLSAVAPTAVANGYTGGAYQFGTGGANTFVTVPIDINPAVMPQVTFGAWVSADVADAVIRGIISHDDGDFDRTLDVDVRFDANARWCMFLGLGPNGICADAVQTDTWVFLAARYDDATNSAWLTVNGTHFAAVGTPGPSVNTTTTIGRNPNFDLPFIGRIDNVFFFDEVLSNAQLDDIRVNGIRLPEPGSMLLIGAALAGLGVARRRR